MITLALDYISRHPSIVRIDPPCSFVAIDSTYNEKMVVVHPLNDNHFLVKTWHITKAKESEYLPPYNEDIIDKAVFWTEPHKLFRDTIRPLRYSSDVPSIKSNMNDQPVQQRHYDAACGNMLFSDSHKHLRECHLWNGFRKCYQGKWTFLKDSYHIGDLAIREIQREAAIEGRRAAGCWNMWKIHMWNFESPIAPELYYWAIAKLSSSSSSSQLSFWE